MKTIRSLMTLAGLFLGFLTMGAVGAQGQVVDTTHFLGTFTLPTTAQWGKMILPAGDYSLRYGTLGAAGIVEVYGMEKGSPYGVILAGPVGETSATRNVIVCIREGNALIVRALEMPVIGESVTFRVPHGTKLMAQRGNPNGYTQLAEVPMLIQRISVTLNAK
jgi:hypothetical protein